MVRLTGMPGIRSRRLVQLLGGLFLGAAVGTVIYGITQVARA